MGSIDNKKACFGSLKSLNIFSSDTSVQFCNNAFTTLSLCIVEFKSVHVCVRFQERSLSCVRQMVVGDPLQSIPVYENTCSYILVSGTEFTAVQLSTFCYVISLLQIQRIITCLKEMLILYQLRQDHRTLHLFVFPRWEASSLWDLWEDFLSVRQQKCPHEEETWRGGAQQWKQRNRSFCLSYSHYLFPHCAGGGYANPWIM